MSNAIKKAVFSLMEKAFTSQGTVMAVRKWQPATMCEIDLHLPGTDMTRWKSIQRVVCKVGSEGEFRDYTPALWHSDKQICTVLIETGHQGDGSTWANGLHPGDPVLFAVTHAAQLPSKPGKILCLGDGSALGHFMALKQLTSRDAYPFEALVSLNEHYTSTIDFAARHPEFKLLMSPQAGSLATLLQHCESMALADYASIYIAGHIPMVTGLRKILKKNPYLNARIFAHGFWS